MKMKLTTLLFGLLLAVGWTNVAQAQLLDESLTTKHIHYGMLPTMSNMSSSVEKQELKNESQTPYLSENAILKDVPSYNGVLKAPNRAPKRAQNTITADATHVFSWYDAINYDWKDANGGSHTNKITEPATNPYQIAYLLGTTYMNPVIPGLKYSAVTDLDNPYPNIEFGWDIPGNSRWPNYDSSAPATNYSDLVISLPTINMTLHSITVYNANDAVLTSWNANTAYENGETSRYDSSGSYRTYYTLPGWSYSNYLTLYHPEGDDNYYGYS